MRSAADGKSATNIRPSARRSLATDPPGKEFLVFCCGRYRAPNGMLTHLVKLVVGSIVAAALPTTTILFKQLLFDVGIIEATVKVPLLWRAHGHVHQSRCIPFIHLNN